MDLKFEEKWDVITDTGEYVGELRQYTFDPNTHTYVLDVENHGFAGTVRAQTMTPDYQAQVMRMGGYPVETQIYEVAADVGGIHMTFLVSASNESEATLWVIHDLADELDAGKSVIVEKVCPMTRVVQV